MRPPRRGAYAKSARHSFAVELVLEFPAAVTGEQALQQARRLLEALQVSSLSPEQALPDAHLRCPALRQVVRLAGGPRAPADETPS